MLAKHFFERGAVVAGGPVPGYTLKLTFQLVDASMNIAFGVPAEKLVESFVYIAGRLQTIQRLPEDMVVAKRTQSLRKLLQPAGGAFVRNSRRQRSNTNRR